jgi:hypothetical protein
VSALVSLLVSKSVLTKIRFRDILLERAGLWAGPFLWFKRDNGIAFTRMTRSGYPESQPQHHVLAPAIQAIASSSNTCATSLLSMLYPGIMLALHGILRKHLTSDLFLYGQTPLNGVLNYLHIFAVNEA